VIGRLNLLLVVALIASALVLVHTSYQARRLFADLDKARNEQQRLDAEYKRLEADAQAQATHGRIDRTARDRLAMRAATPAVTQYVTDGAAAPASGAAR
jgi:cell division protein FtsL